MLQLLAAAAVAGCAGETPPVARDHPAPPSPVVALFDTSDSALARRLRTNGTTTYHWMPGTDSAAPISPADTLDPGDLVRLVADSSGNWVRYDADISTPSGDANRHLTVLRTVSDGIATRLETTTLQSTCAPPVRVVDMVSSRGRERTVLDGNGARADTTCAESVPVLDTTWMRVDSLRARRLFPTNWRALVRAESLRALGRR